MCMYADIIQFVSIWNVVRDVGEIANVADIFVFIHWRKIQRCSAIHGMFHTSDIKSFYKCFVCDRFASVEFQYAVAICMHYINVW